MEQNIQFVNSVDSRLKVLEGKKPVYDLIKGVKATDMKYLESANGNSNTSTQYTIYMNENQILSDYLVEEVDFEVVFNLTAGATITNRPFSNGNIAPRAFVLDSVSQQNQIVINGQSVSFNPQDTLQAILSFNNDENYIGKDYQTGTLDYFTDLGNDASGTLIANPPQAFNKSGTLKSPLLDFTSSTFGKMGRFSDIELINTTLSSVLDFCPEKVTQFTNDWMEDTYRSSDDLDGKITDGKNNLSVDSELFTSLLSENIQDNDLEYFPLFYVIQQSIFLVSKNPSKNKPVKLIVNHINELLNKKIKDNSNHKYLEKSESC